MVKLQTQRVLCTLAVLGTLPLAASAQQAPVEPPAAEKVAPDMAPPSPKAPAARPSETPAGSVAQDLVGLNVFSSDGTRVGEVRSISTGPSGEIVALRFHTGGFLGFGGRIVAIPQGKFIRSGQSIRLDLDSNEVTGLPEVND
jgi:PRC-barrel domain protein